MIEEFKKEKLEILAVTETKKKGTGEITIENHTIIYSGVDVNKRAEAGVGCVISPKYMKKMKEWKAINEKIMVVKLELKNKQVTKLIIVYGPGENDKAKTKEEFWEKLQEVYEEGSNPIIIMGDFNARVGNKTDGKNGVMGRYGEEIVNNNGRRFIDFCIQNRLIIQNTFFQHKDCHKYRRKKKGRNEKSIINYVVTKRQNKGMIKDVRVYRRAELATDHYLLVTKIKINGNGGNRSGIMKQKICREIKAIKIYKLQNKEIRNEYAEIIEKEIDSRKGEIKEGNLEAKWRVFKEILKYAASKTCGVMVTGSTRNRTHWWNEEVKEIVKKKKEAWKVYLAVKTDEAYNNYKEKRKIAKDKIKFVKNQKWEEFGIKIENDYKNNQKLFYRALKNMRGSKKKIINEIQNKEGEVLSETNEIIKRWGEYFQEMLEEGEDEEGYKRMERSEKVNMNAERSTIQIDEVKEAIRTLKNGKAPGVDNMKAEMLKNMGEKGVELLHEIIEEAWKTQEVPTEWKMSVIIPIYKKGDRRKCTNYRGVSLICSASKIYEKVLEKRLRSITETKIHETQSGFRPGYSIRKITSLQ